MITGSFEYHQPESLPAAVALLSELGDDARVIAGGHSLIPMMKLRLATPEHLIDLQSIESLKHISVADGQVSIGAMATQADIIANEPLFQAAPIVRETALQIADPQVRYMGTIGGNVANGDPGNDLPALMQCLNAMFSLQGKNAKSAITPLQLLPCCYQKVRTETAVMQPLR